MRCRRDEVGRHAGHDRSPPSCPTVTGTPTFPTEDQITKAKATLAASWSKAIAGVTVDLAAPDAAAAAAAAPAAAQPLRRAAAAWLAVVPLLLFVAVGFGVPAVAMPTARSPPTPPALAALYTAGNLTASLARRLPAPPCWAASSCRRSTAVIGAVLGLLLAQAVVTARCRAAAPRSCSPPPACWPTSAACRWPSPSSPPSATPGADHRVPADRRHRPARLEPATASGPDLVYLYFLIPLMVLVVLPGAGRPAPQWREAAQNLGATAGSTGGTSAARCSRRGAGRRCCCCSPPPSPPTRRPPRWSAAAVPLVTLQIADAAVRQRRWSAGEPRPGAGPGHDRAHRRWSWPCYAGCSAGAPRWLREPRSPDRRRRAPGPRRGWSVLRRRRCTSLVPSRRSRSSSPSTAPVRQRRHAATPTREISRRRGFVASLRRSLVLAGAHRRASCCC